LTKVVKIVLSISCEDNYVNCMSVSILKYQLYELIASTLCSITESVHY